MCASVYVDVMEYLQFLALCYDGECRVCVCVRATYNEATASRHMTSHCFQMISVIDIESIYLYS